MIAMVLRIVVVFILSIASFSGYAQTTKVVVIPMGGDAAPLQNVITVAKKNGDFTDPVAAMKSIEGMANENNRYLIFIGPGVYTLTETLEMQSYVDISGSGRNVTKLTGDIVADFSVVVKGRHLSKIQSLTIENKGANSSNVGIHNYFASPHISDINIMVEGGTTNYGINTGENSTPKISHSTITVSGGVTSYGIYSIATNSNLHASPRLSDTIIRVHSGTTNYGVYNQSVSSGDTSVTISDTAISAVGGTGAYGVWNNTGSFGAPTYARIRNSTISAFAGTTNNSVVAGTGSGSKETYISDSILRGSVSGNPKCSFVFDNLGTTLNDTCGFIIVFP